MGLENNLDTDDIKGLVLRLAFPSMLAQFVSVFYSIVDRMYIGNIAGIGEVALAGVGICGPIVTLISSIAFLVGVGGSPLMSIRLGQKREEQAKQILSNCFLLLAVLSVIVTVVAILLKDSLLLWFGASDATFLYANDYMSIYLLGTVFALFSIGMNPFIICQGFAKVGMVSVLLGAICNIVLDPVFIFVFGMGVKGAALATVLSQMVSCAYVLLFLFGKRAPVSISFGGYHMSIIKRVIGIGMTPFLIIASDNILIISMNAVIKRYGGSIQGDMLMTCATIVQSFMLMVTMPLGGITSGTQTILGYNYGAGHPERIKKAEKYILLLGLSFTTIMFLIAQFFSKYFVLIFTRDPEYVNLTVWAIKIYTLAIIPLSIQYTIVDGLTGMGISKIAISLSLFRKAIFLVGVFVIPIFFSVSNIFYAEPISDLISAGISAVVFVMVIDRVLHSRKYS